MKYLIVTADDFGLSSEVNEAVRLAHAQGVLTSASLMVAAEKASEAVEIAKAYPTLKVGLHLTLVEGKSILPPSQISALVDSQRNFSNHLVKVGVRYFFSRSAKAQLEAECSAQIEAFLATGLTIDHLNAHNHFHLHPTVLNILLTLAQRYRIRAIRLPKPIWKASQGSNFGIACIMAPWIRRMEKKLKQHEIFFNQFIFGLFETGSMVEDAWLRCISKIPEGVTEVYCHPATQTCGILQKIMPNYRHADELAALLSPKVKAAIEDEKIRLKSFTDVLDLED